MIIFKLRTTNPVSYNKEYDGEYWDVWCDNKKIGWFGCFKYQKGYYTDVAVYNYHRGKGYFKLIYDHFIENYWNGEKLCAFIGHGNVASIRAHEKYGCKIIKHNDSTDEYLVKRARRKK